MGARSSLRRVSVVVGAIGALSLGALTTAGPASADGYVYTAYGLDGGSISEVSPEGYYVRVCDVVSDGHGVYGEFHLKDGTNTELKDENGASAGCNAIEYPSSPVVWFHVYVAGYGAGETCYMDSDCYTG